MAMDFPVMGSMISFVNTAKRNEVGGGNASTTSSGENSIVSTTTKSCQSIVPAPPSMPPPAAFSNASRFRLAASRSYSVRYAAASKHSATAVSVVFVLTASSVIK
eukprot:CCRYP_007758-RD/>CCRYP_007758-RD protein AED:0.49 eAED:1.00 QI:0/0/0/1/0/0/2/0/104